MIQKPPLGVSPHWFVNRKRIEELHEAIGRYIGHIGEHQHIEQHDQYYKAIAMWSREIETLALLEAELEKRERKTEGG